MVCAGGELLDVATTAPGAAAHAFAFLVAFLGVSATARIVALLVALLGVSATAPGAAAHAFAFLVAFLGVSATAPGAAANAFAFLVAFLGVSTTARSVAFLVALLGVSATASSAAGGFSLLVRAFCAGRRPFLGHVATPRVRRNVRTLESHPLPGESQHSQGTEGDCQFARTSFHDHHLLTTSVQEAMGPKSGFGAIPAYKSHHRDSSLVYALMRVLVSERSDFCSANEES